MRLMTCCEYLIRWSNIGCWPFGDVENFECRRWLCRISPVHTYTSHTESKKASSCWPTSDVYKRGVEYPARALRIFSRIDVKALRVDQQIASGLQVSTLFVECKSSSGGGMLNARANWHNVLFELFKSELVNTNLNHWSDGFLGDIFSETWYTIRDIPSSAMLRCNRCAQ